MDKLYFEKLEDLKEFLNKERRSPYLLISSKHYEELSIIRMVDIIKKKIISQIIFEHTDEDNKGYAAYTIDDIKDLIRNWYDSTYFKKKKFILNGPFGDKIVLRNNGKKATLNVEEYVKLEGIYPYYTPYLYLTITNFKTKYKISNHNKFNPKISDKGKFTARIKLSVYDINSFDTDEWDKYKNDMIEFVKNFHIIK